MYSLFLINDQIEAPEGKSLGQGPVSNNQQRPNPRHLGSRPMLSMTSLSVILSSGPNLLEAGSVSAASDAHLQPLPRSQKTYCTFTRPRSNLLSLTLLRSMPCVSFNFCSNSPLAQRETDKSSIVFPIPASHKVKQHIKLSQLRSPRYQRFSRLEGMPPHQMRLG